MLQNMLALRTMLSILKEENMKECNRIGTTVLKIGEINGQIAFYSSAVALQ